MRALQRSRRDRLSALGIAAVSLALVGGMWVSAPIHRSHLEPATEVPQRALMPAVAMPNALQQRWSAPFEPLAHAPLLAAGYPLSVDAHGTVRAIDPANGEARWAYERDVPPCSAASAWDAAVVAYATGRGCGEVVAVQGLSGTYKATRAAHASSEVVPIFSNERAGTVSQERVELWRSDLVRTVVYGEIDVQVEPHQQPHPECVIRSAMTRSTMLAVAEDCQDKTFVRLQNPDPDESSQPEVQASVEFQPGAQVVAVAGDAVAVYEPGAPAHMYVFDQKGHQRSSRPVPNAPAVEASPELFYPATAVAGRFHLWFDGARLYVLDARTLDTISVIDGALGTGAMLGRDLMVPVKDGLALFPMEGSKLIDAPARIIRVDRGGYTGEVSAVVSGDAVVEKRGDTLVGLGA